MKARVDSGEFSRAVRAASKYSKKTGLDVAEGMLLKVSDGSLSIRTTTGSEDCIIWVNAFDPMEDGVAITLYSVLIPSAIDSGGLMEISVDGTKLVLDYEDTRFKLGTMANQESDYPVWVGADPIVGLDTDVLKMAGASTIPFERSGHPLKSAVHIVPYGYPYDETIAVFGTDGHVGYIRYINGSIESEVSIDAQMLAKALSVVGEPVTIGANGGRISVSGSVGDVTFSSVACTDPSSLIAGFNMDVDHGPIKMELSELVRIARLCDSAVGVYEGSEIWISGNGAQIVGYNVDIKTAIDGEFPEGESIFKCVAFSRCIKNIAASTVSIGIKMLEEGNSHYWYIDPTDDSRHFVFSSMPEVPKA